MLYATIAAVVLGAVALAWARRIVKRAMVQPVRLDNGLVLDMRLTEKRWYQVFWDDNKAVIGFVAGAIVGATLGKW